MQKQNYAYVRVSSKEQKENRQLVAIRAIEIPEKNIFMDKLSGKDFQRPNYLKMLKRLRREDVLYIKSIDRLGRNYREILEQWRVLTKERGVDIAVLDMPLLDTRREKNLVGSFISDLVLQVLSFVAENERENIRTRQVESIAAAKERGVRFGRPRRALPENFDEARSAWRDRTMTLHQAAQSCGLPNSTFYRAVVRAEDEEK